MFRFAHIDSILSRACAASDNSVFWVAVLLLAPGLMHAAYDAEARSLELIGVRNESPVGARFIVRESESAFHYETLSLMELPLEEERPALLTHIIDAKKALRHQRAGASDLHRHLIAQEETRLRDDGELAGFALPQEVSCHSRQIESLKPPTHLDMKGDGAGYSWTCVLAAEGMPAARLLLEVRRSATMIHFAPDNVRPVIRVAQIPHMQVEIPHRGVRALPVISLSRAYRVPAADHKEHIFLLVFSRSRPIVPSLNTEHVLVIVHPNSLEERDRGRIAARKRFR